MSITSVCLSRNSIWYARLFTPDSYELWSGVACLTELYKSVQLPLYGFSTYFKTYSTDTAVHACCKDSKALYTLWYWMTWYKVKFSRQFAATLYFTAYIYYGSNYISFRQFWLWMLKNVQFWWLYFTHFYVLRKFVFHVTQEIVIPNCFVRTFHIFSDRKRPPRSILSI